MLNTWLARLLFDELFDSSKKEMTIMLKGKQIPKQPSKTRKRKG
jgi:hypothetical protein